MTDFPRIEIRHGGAARVVRHRLSGPRHPAPALLRDLERAFPDLDARFLAADFVDAYLSHGEAAHGYAVEQTQADGHVSTATLQARPDVDAPDYGGRSAFERAIDGEAVDALSDADAARVSAILEKVAG